MMAELSPEAAGLFRAASAIARTARSGESGTEAIVLALSAASRAVVLAIHALALQLAENAERTQSVNVHVETGV